MNPNIYLARCFHTLAKNMNFRKFFQKISFLAKFLQTIRIFQESCRQCNSCKNLVRILQSTPCQNPQRLVIFCKILQDPVRIMHYLPNFCRNHARILKEMHLVSTRVISTINTFLSNVQRWSLLVLFDSELIYPKLLWDFKPGLDQKKNFKFPKPGVKGVKVGLIKNFCGMPIFLWRCQSRCCKKTVQ